MPQKTTSKCLQKRGIIELGTNRVKSKIYEYNTCLNQVVKINDSFSEPIEFSDTFEFDSRDTITISPVVLKKGLDHIKLLKLKMDGQKVEKISVIATGVFRKASNTERFFKDILSLVNSSPVLISSLEEATLALDAVSFGNPAKSICVCDIGGDSMLLACKSGDKSAYAIGLPGSQVITNKLAISDGYRPLDTRLAYYEQNFKNSNVTKVRDFLKNFPSTQLYGIGGVHERSILETLKVMNKNQQNSYNLADVTSLYDIFKGAKKSSFTGSYGKNQFLNVDLVLFTMRYLNIDLITVAQQKPLDAYMRKK